MSPSVKPLSNLTYEEAVTLIGTYFQEGRCIGTSNTPKLGLPSGIYLTLVNREELTQYFKVGESECTRQK